MKNNITQSQDFSSQRWTLIFSGFLCLAFITRIPLVFMYEINWDEFYYLSFVHDLQRSALTAALQTWHVHLFGWLPLISTNEVDQIVAARIVMLILQIATGWFIYKIALEFVARNFALFSALVYFSFTYVIWQGTSFRTDPIAAFLLMAALYIFMRPSRSYKSAVLAGILIALATLITIKSVIYFPTFATILLLRAYSPVFHKENFFYGALAGVTAVICASILYYLHNLSINPDTHISSADILDNSYRKMIHFQNLFPQWIVFYSSLKMNMIFWLLTLSGIIICLLRLWYIPGLPRTLVLILLSFSLPLLSLIFYRNAFPYYYAFMLPPVAIICGFALQNLVKRYEELALVIVGTVLFFCFINLIGNGLVRPIVKPLHTQRTVLAEIHRLFPEPVSYLDRCSMVSSFPKTGFFMSTWGIEDYREGRKPTLVSNIIRDQPKFMLANNAQLDFANPDAAKIPDAYRFLDNDQRYLKDNFIPHWGPLYLAGKKFNLKTARQTEIFHIIIEGPYTLHSAGTALIDGKKYSTGDIVFLTIGRHTISSSINSDEIILKWGENTAVPSFPPPTSPLFTTF